MEQEQRETVQYRFDCLESLLREADEKRKRLK
jgi:hypothetical protein